MVVDAELGRKFEAKTMWFKGLSVDVQDPYAVRGGRFHSGIDQSACRLAGGKEWLAVVG